jgi:S-adenosylmethionine:tRNA ribosyltransferase-isomerase
MSPPLDVSAFDYDLPEALIAQEAPERGGSRLLVLPWHTGEPRHALVSDIGQFLEPGDLMVLNNTRVCAARLLGRRVPSGGRVECLLLGRIDSERWDALMHPGQKLRVGERFRFERAGVRLEGEVLERHFFGRRTVRLWADGDGDVDELIEVLGQVPLPPYIRRDPKAEDRERYQTVYARVSGSVAAPTAGLHFTRALLDQLANAGVEQVEITLHVGYGTFKPVRAAAVEEHVVDPEPYTIGESAAAAINRALDEKRRVIAVGTTSTRALESAARAGDGRVVAGSAVTDLFIHPGVPFLVVGGLLTNFHLPRSSLLMLVCAFAGRERVLAAYREAIASRYRFYSYGDAMLIL